MSLTKIEIDGLLAAPSENLNVEIKSWFDPDKPTGQAKFIKATFALRNRNGGYLIVGIDNNTLRPTSVDEIPSDCRRAFNVDNLCGIVSKYASIPFEVFIGTGTIDSQECYVIKVPEGVRCPVAVKADLLDPSSPGKHLLQNGDVYFRTLRSNGTPSSARASYQDWPDIVDVCFENRDADFGRFLRRHLGGDGAIRLSEALSAALPRLNNQKSLEKSCMETLDQGKHRLLEQISKRRLTTEQESILKRGSWSVALVVDPPRDNALPTQEFFNTVSSANPRLTGWPAWLDSRGFRDKGANLVVADNGWEALIFGSIWEPSIDHFDFYRFDPTGKFYLFRILQDDLNSKITPGSVLDPILVVLRVAEVIAVGLSIVNMLGWDEDSNLGFAFKWEGIGNRALSTWASPGVYISTRHSHQESVSSFVEVPLSTPLAAIAPYVEEAVKNLVILFDGFVLPSSIIESWIQKLIERRL
jgi:hypothetical protein